MAAAYCIDFRPLVVQSFWVNCDPTSRVASHESIPELHGGADRPNRSFALPSHRQTHRFEFKNEFKFKTCVTCHMMIRDCSAFGS